jgi:hypothetical protein
MGNFFTQEPTIKWVDYESDFVQFQKNPIVYLDISIDGKTVGRITIELFADTGINYNLYKFQK